MVLMDKPHNIICLFLKATAENLYQVHSINQKLEGYTWENMQGSGPWGSGFGNTRVEHDEVYKSHNSNDAVHRHGDTGKYLWYIYK